MSEPLDVALRIRLAYEGANAQRAKSDLEAIHAAAAKFSGRQTGTLAADVAKVAPAAETAKRNVVDLATAAARLGSSAAYGIRKVGEDITAIGRATQPAKRDVIDLHTALARYEGIQLGKNLRRDFQALSQLTSVARRDVLDLGRATDKLGEGRAVGRLGDDLATVGRNAEKAAHRMEELHRRYSGRGGGERGFADEALNASGMGGLARLYGMSAGGAAGLAAGAGVAAIGGALAQATRQAIDFETAMSDVQKATNATDEQLKAYGYGALRVARETGLSRAQIAGGMAQAGYAGIPNEDILRFSRFSAKTAGAFDMSATDAGDQLAKLRNVFGFNQGQLEDAANGINVLGDTTAAKERQILAFLGEAGSASRLVGMKPLHAAAYGATMEATGMEPGQAATSFSAMLEILGSANKQPKHVKDALRALRLSGRTVQRGMQDDPDGTIQEVLQRINALPEKGPNSKLGVIRDIFGQEHAREVATLAGQVDNLRKSLDRMDDASIRAGSVEKTFQIFSETTRGRVSRMNEAVGAFAVSLGNRFSPAVGAAADVVTKFFNKLNDGAERSEKALAIFERIRGGQAPTPEQQADMDADPTLKGQVDAEKAWQSRKRLYMGEPGKAAPVAPAHAARPHAPDAEDAAAAEARERNRATMLDQIQRLGREIDERGAGGYHVQEDRLRLEDMRRRYRKTFGGRPAGEEDGTPPGAEKRADLADRARINFAAYDAEVATGMSRAVRIVDTASQAIRKSLMIRADFRILDGEGGEGGGIINASYGGGGVGGAGGYGIRTGGGRFNGAVGDGGAVGRAARHYGGGSASSGPMQYGSGADAGTRYNAKGGRGLTDAGRERVGSWMNFFMRAPGEGGMGLPRGRAAAMVAMMQGESGQNLDPGKEYWDVNGPSGGTAAWHDIAGKGPGRLSALKAFAAKLGKPWTSVEAQQQFWKHEAETSERKAWNAVRNASSDEEALHKGVENFERPRDIAGETRKRMPNLARILRGDFSKAPVAKLPPTTLPDEARRSPRFQVPDQLRVDAGVTMGAGGSGRRQQVAMAGGPPVIQNFHGGYDTAAVIRQSQREQNRMVRRTLASSLHDVGGPA